MNVRCPIETRMNRFERIVTSAPHSNIQLTSPQSSPANYGQDCRPFSDPLGEHVVPGLASRDKSAFSAKSSSERWKCLDMKDELSLHFYGGSACTGMNMDIASIIAKEATDQQVHNCMPWSFDTWKPDEARIQPAEDRQKHKRQDTPSKC